MAEIISNIIGPFALGFLISAYVNPLGTSMAGIISSIIVSFALGYLISAFIDSLRDYIEKKYSNLTAGTKQAIIWVSVFALALVVVYLAKYLYIFFVN